MSKEDRIYIHGHLLYILQTISDWCSMSSQYPNGNGFYLSSKKQRQGFYFHLASLMDLIDVMDVQNKLMINVCHYESTAVSVSSSTVTNQTYSSTSTASSTSTSHMSSSTLSGSSSSITSKVKAHQMKLIAKSSSLASAVPINRRVCRVLHLRKALHPHRSKVKKHQMKRIAKSSSLASTVKSKVSISHHDTTTPISNLNYCTSHTPRAA